MARKARTPAEARAALAAAVKAEGNPERVSYRVGCTRSYIDMIVKGSRTPQGPYAKKIQRLYGIPVDAWYEEHKGGEAP